MSWLLVAPSLLATLFLAQVFRWHPPACLLATMGGLIATIFFIGMALTEDNADYCDDWNDE